MIIDNTTNHELRVTTLRGWIGQTKAAKIITVVEKNRNRKVTVRTKS